MKILLLSRYEILGASSRVRCYQYLPFLRAHGINVTVSALLSDDYLCDFYCGRISHLNHLSVRIGAYFKRVIELIKSRRFDLLWIQSELFPWLPAGMEMILSCVGIPYLVDYDDATFHRYDAHSNMVVRRFLGNKIKVVMRNASLVTAGNDYLMEYARKAGARRMAYLPTVVDLDKYRVEKPVKDKVLIIGWIGIPHTIKYLPMIAPALSEWGQKMNLRFVIIGADAFNLHGIDVEFHNWSQDSEVSEIQKIDVGIMPLADNLWEKGKCGYKLIQYMACGKPVIASPVGVNSKIVEHGVNGFLADSKEEWIEALDVLYADSEKRLEMGRKGREKVEKNYCVQVTAPRLFDLICSCVS